jgi:SAM-dependent methyltransferase
VVAIDIDTRNLDPQRSPNLYIQEVDIVTHEFAPSSCDLIHARAVLCHLSAREEVLSRACQWISPGGWLVVEDAYTLLGSGGLPDQLWRINLQQAGSHMSRSGLLTEAELAECLNLLDNPNFVDIRAGGRSRVSRRGRRGRRTRRRKGGMW